MGLEDLLIEARLRATMPAAEFWVKCEGIVQKLDDKRQELPMGGLKQAHNRLLFILTRCNRLVQFRKESGYVEEHILKMHQLCNISFVPSVTRTIKKLLEIARSVGNVNFCGDSSLDFMIEQLDELNYVIQDRKADALVVETFWKTDREAAAKYIKLCGLIDDEKVDSSNTVVEEESSADEDVVRSLRTSPLNPRAKDRTSIEDFEIIKPISRGAFGRVFLARKRATGDLFAIKVRFFYSFTCRENLYLVMEYLNGGDLFSLLRNLGCLDEDMARIYIAEVVRPFLTLQILALHRIEVELIQMIFQVLPLEYLPSVNIIHRDLKPDNLLINQDGHIKLTDFGLSKVGLINSTDDLSGDASLGNSGFFAEDGRPQHSQGRDCRKKHEVVGTPDYLAPEILLGMGHGKTADWWSVGVILFEVLVGIPPFNAETPQQIFENLINRDIPWPSVPDEISYEAYDLINKLLTENPVQRLGATGLKSVKRHNFFKDINWDTLARQKAMFVPSAEPQDTSYFMSRYKWNPEDETVHGVSDFDDLTDTCSSSSSFNTHEEDGDECGNLAEFGSGPNLAVKYSFSNFSFKNLSQLASINYDLVQKNAKESTEASNQSAGHDDDDYPNSQKLNISIDSIPMAKHYKVLFLVLSISYLFSGELTAAATATTTTKKALSFIKSSCKTTTYRSLCVHSLSTYANTIQTNPQRLIKTALAVTMKHAQSTKLLVSNLKNSQYRTLQDCAPSPYVFTIDRLTEAVRELKLSDSESVQSQFLFHVSKTQALFTSASDDWEVENTCSGRFSSTAKSVQARLVNLRKETSNAPLAVIGFTCNGGR
ncbi:hypothetical protein Bca101_052189 [Brassica carinata]